MKYIYGVVYIRWYINIEKYIYEGNIYIEEQMYGKTYI